MFVTVIALELAVSTYILTEGRPYNAESCYRLVGDSRLAIRKLRCSENSDPHNAFLLGFCCPVCTSINNLPFYLLRPLVL